MDTFPTDPNQLQLEFYDSYAVWPTINGYVHLMSDGVVADDKGLSRLDIGESVWLQASGDYEIEAEWTAMGWRYHHSS